MASMQIKQGDISPAFQTTLTDSAGAPILLTGASVTFRMRKHNMPTYTVEAAATIVNVSTGVVKYDWIAADTATDGVYLAEWYVVYSDGADETFPNEGYDTVHVERKV